MDLPGCRRGRTQKILDYFNEPTCKKKKQYFCCSRGMAAEHRRVPKETRIQWYIPFLHSRKNWEKSRRQQMKSSSNKEKRRCGNVLKTFVFTRCSNCWRHELFTWTNISCTNTLLSCNFVSLSEYLKTFRKTAVPSTATFLGLLNTKDYGKTMKRNAENHAPYDKE